MEVNKGEAERCRDMGAEALRRGQYARAIKLLKKSLQLYPLPGVEALLGQAEAKFNQSSSPTASADPSSSSGNSAPERSSSTRPEMNRSSSIGTGGRTYTEVQVKIVKQVLQAKEGGRGAHYRVLGLETNASESDLKKSYRRLALKLHPDKNSAPHADEAFKAVGLAYATLSDPQKRTIYDRYGEEDPDNRGGSGRAGGGVHFRGGQEVSPEEIFNMFFGGGMPGGMNMHHGPGGFRVYSNGFGGGFGAPRPQYRRRQQQAPPQREETGWAQLTQLLPLIIILLVSFFNFPSESGHGATGGNRYFSLTHSPPFVNPLATKLTSVKDIPYYVSDKFMRTYYRDRYQLAQVERMVEKSYENYLVAECKNQKVYKRQLQKAAERAGMTEEDRERQQKKAREFELTRCSELEDLFPLRTERDRKTSSQRYR